MPALMTVTVRSTAAELYSVRLSSIIDIWKIKQTKESWLLREGWNRRAPDTHRYVHGLSLLSTVKGGGGDGLADRVAPIKKEPEQSVTEMIDKSFPIL